MSHPYKAAVLPYRALAQQLPRDLALSRETPFNNWLQYRLCNDRNAQCRAFLKLTAR